MALSIIHSILRKRIHNASSAYQKIHCFNNTIINKIGKQALNVKYQQFMLLYTSQHFYKKRKTAEEKKSTRIIQYPPKSKASVIEIWKHMTVADVANALGKDTDHVFEVMTFVDNSVKYTRPNSIIDNWQVVQDIVRKSGYKFRVIGNPHLNAEIMDKDKDIIKSPLPDSSELVKRPPVVTIMGHVDHGKTTLLDSLRHTAVAASEFGGITQHIGAFSVKIGEDCPVTFLDTPGHAAFTAMRARGADVTDIVVLVVAADDGVMEQTIESIRMAKEANVPIIVAINKIDRPNCDINKTKKMLLMSGIQVEDEGGDVQVVPISALHGTNLHQLVEALVLQAEIMELKGDPVGMVEGVIIESEIDPHRGKLATAIIKRGTLRKGTILVAGIAWCKVRAMFDSNGIPLQEAGLSTPVQIIGWREFVSAGDEILEVESEKRANEVIKWRASKQMEMKQDADNEKIMLKVEEHRKAYEEQLKKKRLMGRYKTKPTGPRQKEIVQDDGVPKVSIILKGDVDGSVEAILDVLDTYNSNSQCKLDVVHYGVGNVNENDIELAEIFDAIIYSFNIEVPKKLSELVKSKNITIRHHKVIYRLVDDLKKEINLKLPKKQVELILGEANVLQEFIVTENRKKVPVAGCRCATGFLKKSALFRLLRDGHVEYEGTLDSMRHLKSEVESIKKDTECGIRLADFSVRFLPSDTLVCYEVREESQITDWNPGF